VPQSI